MWILGCQTCIKRSSSLFSYFIRHIKKQRYSPVKMDKSKELQHTRPLLTPWQRLQGDMTLIMIFVVCQSDGTAGRPLLCVEPTWVWSPASLESSVHVRSDSEYRDKNKPWTLTNMTPKQTKRRCLCYQKLRIMIRSWHLLLLIAMKPSERESRPRMFVSEHCWWFGI